MIIIGVGPAGLSAALYSVRYKLRTLIIGQKFGGWMPFAPKVENFPGFKAISGMELTKKFKEQLEDYEIEHVKQDVFDIVKERDLFKVKTKNGTVYECKNIILATGTEKRKLRIEGEEEFLGKGISYCVTCDAAMFNGKKTAVVGGGNSAAVAALLLAEYCPEVTLLYRGTELKATPALTEQIKKNDKIKVMFESVPTKAEGGDFLNKIIINDKEELEIDGLFIEIGSIPIKVATKNIDIHYTEQGYIKVNSAQETNVDCVFAAGDVTNNPLKQIITACAEGAVAANSTFKCSLEKK